MPKEDDDDTVVDAIELSPVDLDGEAPTAGRDPQLEELLRSVVPNIVAGNAQQAVQWAKLYGMGPQRYRIVYNAQHLMGLAPNKDIIVLVGTYRQDRAWELCELVQALGKMGIRTVYGGQF